MKLIDAVALMQELDREVEFADDWKTAHEIANIVKYFPTFEFNPEIIRCKDCKYWLKTTLSTVDGEPVYDCPLLNEWGDEDGFCSFAERRTDE